MENPAPARKKVVLIVDDEPDICEVMAFQFEIEGYETCTAANGREAFEIVKARQIDAVVSDVRMPGGGGAELLDRIKANNIETPVFLFITGFSDFPLEEAFDHGAEAVFSKPVDVKALMSAVEQAMSPREDRYAGKRGERLEPGMRIEVLLPGFETATKGRLLNVGRGGLFVAMDGNLPHVNATIAFRIVFEDGHWPDIEGQGIVRWVRPFTANGRTTGFGLEFLELADGARQKILEVINATKTKAYIPLC